MTIRKLSLLLICLFSLQVGFAQSPLAIKKDGKWGAIDQNGKVVIQPEYEFIGPFGEIASQKSYWAYFRKEGKTGVLNAKGEEIIKAEYEQARIFAQGLVAVWQRGKVGLLNAKGEWIIEPEYDMVEPLGESSSLLRTTFKGMFGVSDLNGKVIHTCIFDELDKSTQGYTIARVSQNGKLGALEVIGGTLVLPAEFDKVEVNMFKAVGYKLKEIVSVEIDEAGTITKKEAFNNQMDFDLTQKKNQNEKIKEFLQANPDENKPQWVEDNFRYKLVSPFGKKLIREEFFALSEEPELGLAAGILENDEKLLECYLIDVKQAKVLFGKVAKDMVLSDFVTSDYARITIDTLWDALINKQGEIIEQLNGQDITNIGNFQDGRASVQLGNKFGFINGKGEIAIPIEFEVVSEFKDGYAIGRKGGKFGCIDVNGKVIIPFEHDGIAQPDGNLIRLKKGGGRTGKWGLYTLDGKQVLPQEFNLIDEFSDGQALVIKNGKYGLIDQKGSFILQPSIQADRIFPFKNGIAQVGNELMVENIKGVPNRRYKRNGYIDIKGNFIIEPKYDYIFKFDSVYQAESGLAQVVLGKFVGFIDAKGKEVVSPKYAGIQGFEEVYTAGKGLAKIVNSDGKFGYIDHRGNLVLNPAFSSVENFEACLADTNVWAKASDDGKFGFINHKGETKISFVYDNISYFTENTAIVKQNGKYGLVNRQNEIVLPLEYNGIKFLKGSDRKFLMVYKENPTYYHFNANGQVVKAELVKADDAKSEGVKNSKYKYITGFDENGLAIIEDNGLKGLANKSGKILFKPQYRVLEPFSDGMALFQVDHKDRKKRLFGYLDISGKEVIPATFSKAMDFSNGKAAIFRGRWGYIDKKGNTAIPAAFRQAEAFSGGYAVVNETEIIDEKGTRAGVLGMEGKIISGFSSDRATLQTLSGKLHIKPDGMPAYYTKFDEVSNFSGKIAFVKRGEKWILTRQAGETETKVPFSRAAKNAYIAKYGERYKRKTPFGEIKDIKWTLEEEGVWRMIDQNGNLLSDALYDEVLSDKTTESLKARKDGFFGIVNLNGEFITQPVNEVITLAGEGLFRIEYQGKVGYLKADGTWLWELK